MKCEICRAGDAGHLWQPFGPTASADSFLQIGPQSPDFPVISVCTPCRERIQQKQTVQFTYQRFSYQVSDGRVELLPSQKLAGHAVKKAELVGDRVIHVEACVSLTSDGTLVIPEVIVTLASKRRIRYSTTDQGFSNSLPIKYCIWDNQPAQASG